MRVEPFRRGRGSGSGPRSRAVSGALFLGIALAFLLPFATVSCDDEDRTTFTGLELATRNVPETPTDVEGATLSSMIEDSGANAATFVLLCVAAGCARRPRPTRRRMARVRSARRARVARARGDGCTALHHGSHRLLARAGLLARRSGLVRRARARPALAGAARPSAVGDLPRPLLTLGLYQVYWHYAVNRDLNDYGMRLGGSSGLRVRPWLSVLALTLGALVLVPAFVTIWRTFRRIQRAGVLAGVEDRSTHGSGWCCCSVRSSGSSRSSPSTSRATSTTSGSTRAVQRRAAMPRLRFRCLPSPTGRSGVLRAHLVDVSRKPLRERRR